MVNQHFLYTIAERKEVLWVNGAVHAKMFKFWVVEIQNAAPTSLNPTWKFSSWEIGMTWIHNYAQFSINYYFQAIVNTIQVNKDLCFTHITLSLFFLHYRLIQRQSFHTSICSEESVITTPIPTSVVISERCEFHIQQESHRAVLVEC